jgi:hypothetical protein
MLTPQLESQNRLHGFSIFLSASIPTAERKDEYERIPEAPLRIEEAVMSVARAIFMEGGTLVFGGHPSISPLVARVMDYYCLPPSAEELPRGIDRSGLHVHWKNPSLVVFQSRVWEEYWAEATTRLTKHPFVQVHWTKKEPEEYIDLAIKDRPQAPKSMARMRKEMIEKTSPVAMIAIGGMKGVLDEAKIFATLRPKQAIFSLATTGGAAALLAKQEYGKSVQVVDADAEQLVQEFWQLQMEQNLPKLMFDMEKREYYIPYAFIAQRIVSYLLKKS